MTSLPSTTDIEATLEEIRPLVRLIVWERIGKQHWLADDAEQEAMVRAWQRLDEGHSIGIAIHAAKQAVIDVVRGRRATGSKRGGGVVDTHTKSESIFKETGEGDAYAYEPPDDKAQAALSQIEARETLRGALNALNDRDRDIVAATYLEGLTQAEVARRHGVTRQAISLRLKAALGIMHRSMVAA